MVWWKRTEASRVSTKVRLRPNAIIAAIRRLFVACVTSRSGFRKHRIRIRDLGIATAQTAVVIGTMGLLGAGYYGYHRSSTGGAIQRLVPEWEVHRDTLVAQAGPLTAPPTCTQDPPSRQGTSTASVPTLSIYQTLPFSGLICTAWAMPTGSIALGVDSRGGNAGTNFVGQTCLEHNKHDVQASGTLRLCYGNIVGSGHGYTDYFKHGCKKCLNPPARSCSGLMCSMGTRAIDIGLTPSARFSVGRKIRGFEFSAAIQFTAPGFNIRGGVHTIRNGTDRECGDCSREVINGVSGVERPDCDRITVHWPFAQGLSVSGSGVAAAGPTNATLNISGGLEGNVRYLKESGACVQSNSRACMLGSFSMWGGWNVTAATNSAVAVTIAKIDCSVTWTANDCSQNRRATRSGNCTEPIYFRVTVAGVEFPF